MRKLLSEYTVNIYFHRNDMFHLVIKLITRKVT